MCDVHKYCRPWAIAQEPETRDGAITPVAPYAVDESESAEVDVATGHRQRKLTSTCRAAYNKGWSKDASARAKTMPPAGGGASDREPHCSVEAARCIQHGGSKDYSGTLSQYQHASDAKALARLHRRNEAARVMPHNIREARWYKCFRQLEGQWQKREDAQTRVTGTDFSVLPAGYVPKGGCLPQRDAVERYGATPEVEEPALPPTKAASNSGGGNQKASSAPMAWLGQVAGDDAGKSPRQKGFNPWPKAAAAKQRSGRKKLKGAEYMKAPIPTWLKEMPSKLRHKDLLAALKPLEKGGVKKASNGKNDAIPFHQLYA